MSTTSTKKPYLHFIGNNASDVTGSCTIVRWKDKRIAVDMGLIQTNNIMADYKANCDQIRKIKPKDLDAVLITHALHTDHAGGLLLAVHHGLSCPVYVPVGTLGIFEVMLADSVKIMMQDALKLQRNNGEKYTPLADEADIDKVLGLCQEVEFGQKYEVVDGVFAKHYHAGHIIASSQILLEMKDGYKTIRVGFTGDINTNGISVSVPSIEPLPFCDILVGENTYNEPTRCYSVKKDRYHDEQLILTAIEQYKKILIPVFANQRLEDVLQALDKLEVKMPVYVDTPLGIRIYNLWPESLSFNLDLHFVESWESSVALQNTNKHCIILASSGMLTAGRALGHLKTLLPKSDNAILFAGYSGENTLASEIKRGNKELKVDGDLVKNKAQIYNLKTFSSHANYNQLMDYYTTIRFNKIALVHGEQTHKVDFAHVLQDKLHDKGNAARVVAVNKDQKIYF